MRRLALVLGLLALLLCSGAEAAGCPDALATLQKLPAWKQDTQQFLELLRIFFQGNRRRPSRRGGEGRGARQQA